MKWIDKESDLLSQKQVKKETMKLDTVGNTGDKWQFIRAY